MLSDFLFVCCFVCVLILYTESYSYVDFLFVLFIDLFIVSYALCVCVFCKHSYALVHLNYSLIQTILSMPLSCIVHYHPEENVK